MDDSYLIHESKEYLEYCLERIREICSELKITKSLAMMPEHRMLHSGAV